MSGHYNLPGLKNALTAAGFVVACFCVVGVGQLLVGEGTGEWYRNLQTPPFTPPDWLVGPVWTLLYVCMGLAAWFVWRKRRRSHVCFALTLFVLQLLLNAAWPPIFFGCRNPGLAFGEIVALWIAITATASSFFRISTPAGWLMVPYLAWVTFAAVLNGFIWRMNV
jgi:tryptophan-rich sensory protein